MNIINTYIHGVLDYFLGTFLMVSPWIFGFTDGDSAQNTPMIIGGSMLVYSIFTNYELGIVRMLAVRFHLALDLAAGLILIFSPLLFGFSHQIVIPHVVSGFIVGLFALITQTPIRNQKEWMIWHFRRQISK
ncbi:MAG: hypothetical protein K0S12_1150 [Bacteroidetes bacterium]|jgi:hypothetical protein|nr:hypothetical protein [Bacteroidota bacterium]